MLMAGAAVLVAVASVVLAALVFHWLERRIPIDVEHEVEVRVLGVTLRRRISSPSLPPEDRAPRRRPSRNRRPRHDA